MFHSCLFASFDEMVNRDLIAPRVALFVKSQKSQTAAAFSIRDEWQACSNSVKKDITEIDSLP